MEDKFGKCDGGQCFLRVLWNNRHLLLAPVENLLIEKNELQLSYSKSPVSMFWVLIFLLSFLIMVHKSWMTLRGSPASWGDARWPALCLL
jgi:hypothetical protein